MSDRDGKNVVGMLVLVCNLGVLGLTMKLYTEYFKDRSQGQRKSGGDR